MSQKRCVLLRDYNFAKQSDNTRKKVCELIKNLPDTTCFVIYISAFEIDYKKPEKWNITHPEIITEIHKSYYENGSIVYAIDPETLELKEIFRGDGAERPETCGEQHLISVRHGLQL